MKPTDLVGSLKGKLSARAFNGLLYKFGPDAPIRQVLDTPDESFEDVPNFGQTSLAEVRRLLPFKGTLQKADAFDVQDLRRQLQRMTKERDALRSRLRQIAALTVLRSFPDET